MEKNTEIAKREEQGLEKASSPLYEVVPAVDIFEDDNEILLYADMPGVLKENIQVDIDNGNLSLAGTRKLETSENVNWEEFVDVKYVRSFSVPQTIDVDKVAAELKEGVLCLHLPKSEAAKPRRIDIKMA